MAAFWAPVSLCSTTPASASCFFNRSIASSSALFGASSDIVFTLHHPIISRQAGASAHFRATSARKAAPRARPNYTPRMQRLAGVLALMSAVVASGCMSSTPPQPPPAPAPVVQAPPDTEIYLAPMKTTNGAIEIGPAIDITNNPGYDNQPFFTPDDKAILFTSVRGSGTQTDIYKYDIAAKTIVQVTNTPESEYSPTITPAGKLSVIRVELDAGKTQRLWQFTPDERDPQPVLETVKPVGYHAWADHQTLALFVLGASTGPGASEPATLQLADTRTGTAVVLASDVGRSIQRIPGSDSVSAISFVQRERSGDTVKLVIKELNPSTRQISTLTAAVAGSTEADCAWTPDGTLLMAHGGMLYGWRR